MKMVLVSSPSPSYKVINVSVLGLCSDTVVGWPRLIYWISFSTTLTLNKTFNVPLTLQGRKLVAFIIYLGDHINLCKI